MGSRQQKSPYERSTPHSYRWHNEIIDSNARQRRRQVRSALIYKAVVRIRVIAGSPAALRNDLKTAAEGGQSHFAPKTPQNWDSPRPF